MTIKEKIEILKQYRNLELEYNVRHNYYLQLKEKMNNPAPSIQILSDMPAAHMVSNQNENNHIMLETFEERFGERLRKLLDELYRIETAIDNINDSILRSILFTKYVQGMSFEEVTQAINISWSHTHRLHWKALTIIKL